MRFATSLGIGARRPVVHDVTSDAVLASSSSARAKVRGHQLLFAGYIANRASLRRSLELPSTASDAELYAAAFARWDDAADLNVIGEFATVLWQPDSQSIRLSRSPLNAPPLHIWHDHNRAIIASISRAIFATGEVEQKLDRQKIADSLFLNYGDAERDWFEGVARLPVGCRAIIDPDGIRIDRYYDLGDAPDVRFRRDDDYVEAASALFEQATRAALDGFSRPAVSLSGGYDSQAVAAFALGARPGARLTGFTSVPEPGWDGATSATRFGDERPHVAALGSLYPDLDIRFIDAAGLSFDHLLADFFLFGGGPPRNVINLHWLHAIRAAARADGCDVLLVGTMGNASFSFDGNGSRPNRRGPRRAIVKLMPDRLVAAIRRWRSGEPLSPYERWCPVRAEWAEAMRVEARSAPPPSRLRSTRDVRLAMFGNAMNEGGAIQQAMAMIHGIPQRDPTAYRPLVEFCMGIPDDQFVRNGQMRLLAKRMLRGKVPDMVLDETRRGLQSADWRLRLARNAPELKAELLRLADDPEMAAMLALDGLVAALDRIGTSSDATQEQRLKLALPRALTTARFITFVEGRNG